MNPYAIELTVRDYELDAQGIVNNSVYQNGLNMGKISVLLPVLII